MSEKPRVYQGVRVKTTVKELLQRHRAREASSRKPPTAFLEQAELCASIPLSRHEDPPPVDMGSRAPQLLAPSFPVPDSACSLHMQPRAFSDPQQHHPPPHHHHQPHRQHEQQQHFGDVMLPRNGYSFSPRPAVDYSPPLAALPWSHALSSEVDHYGQGMATYSSSESLTLCTPLDHNSYSPQDSFSSSSSSSCYDSPSRIESSFHGFPSESYPYQHCSPHQDSGTGCWPAQQDTVPVLDYSSSYYNPTDYPYMQPVDESYFRKDFPLGSEMCYNVL